VSGAYLRHAFASLPLRCIPFKKLTHPIIPQNTAQPHLVSSFSFCDRSDESNANARELPSDVFAAFLTLSWPATSPDSEYSSFLSHSHALTPTRCCSAKSNATVFPSLFDIMLHVFCFASPNLTVSYPHIPTIWHINDASEYRPTPAPTLNGPKPALMFRALHNHVFNFSTITDATFFCTPPHTAAVMCVLSEPPHCA